MTYTSDFFNFTGTTSRSLALTLSNITPGLTVGADGLLSNFVTDLTGGFASGPAPVMTQPVPEPASVVLFGIGLSGRRSSPSAATGRGWPDLSRPPAAPYQ